MKQSIFFTGTWLLGLITMFTPRPHAHEARHRIAEYAYWPSPVAMVAPSTADNQPQNDNQSSNEHSPDWNAVLVIVTSITAGLIFWQAWETRRAAQAAADSVGEIKRQADIMDSQKGILAESVQAAKDNASAAKSGAEAAQTNINIFISKERARLIVRAWHLELVPVKGLCAVRYDVIRCGPTDAFIIDTGVWADAVDSENAKPFPLWLAITEIPPVVHPNRDLFHCETWIDLSAEAIQEINNGTKIARIYGFIRYRDVFDFVRATTFRYVWRPPSLYAVPGVISGGWAKADGSPGDNAET